MKWIYLVEAIVVNAVLIILLVLISQNYGLRIAYWKSEGFTPTTVRYPFFLITHAVNGSTTIPGLLTVDWQQVLALILIGTDAIYAWSAIEGRRTLDASERLNSPA